MKCVTRDICGILVWQPLVAVGVCSECIRVVKSFQFLWAGVSQGKRQSEVAIVEFAEVKLGSLNSGVSTNFSAGSSIIISLIHSQHSAKFTMQNCT